ncbi:RICIN domain-containing protein [Paenibacillus humicus]|uniref:RICIN domain-containing protein n=1 Tax=Paenibacillus humicus TaxID=412861 RepID=UPI001FE32F14|nr:hypothetical protein [Paenibacillus humicus]
MKRFRAAAAALMAVMLLLASLPAYGAGAAAQGGNGAGDIPAGKMRIKNMWQNNYLYEASDGTVRYGMTSPGDESSHWEVEAAGGSYSIRNSKTGHYITASETPQRRDALKARQVANPSESEQWHINPTATSGFMNIVSAADSSGKRAIHEEDQLGFAELSSDINLEFESPKWMLVPVDAVQIESRFHPGMVLYEYEGQIAGQDASVVGFGVKSDKDFNAQWYIEPGSVPGKVQIRNRGTGHLIKQGPLEWAAMPAGDPDPSEPGLTDWLQESSSDGLGYATFANGKFDLYLLNAQFPDDRDARSNSWPGSKSNPSAQWRIVSPSALQPVRIASYTDANSPTDYLYEEAGALKHGALASDPAKAADYLWFVEDFDGTKRLRNSATGHYLTRSGGTLSALDAGFGTPESQWTLTLSDDYDDYQTIGAAGGGDVFVTGRSDGTVQAAADASSLGAQWQLVDPSLPADGADHYVRIQNGWQPFYLYETADGLLKYGNAKDDTSDQWLIRKHEGRKLFQNRLTGHYINISDMPDGHIQVSPSLGPEQRGPQLRVDGAGYGRQLQPHQQRDGQGARQAAGEVRLSPEPDQICGIRRHQPGLGKPEMEIPDGDRGPAAAVQVQGERIGRLVSEGNAGERRDRWHGHVRGSGRRRLLGGLVCGGFRRPRQDAAEKPGKRTLCRPGEHRRA